MKIITLIGVPVATARSGGDEEAARRTSRQARGRCQAPPERNLWIEA